MKEKILFWLPRILCILGILLISLFSLDSFSTKGSLVQNLLGFLVHNIPSGILILMLVLAWKHEFTGGIVFIIFSLTFIILYIYRVNNFTIGIRVLNSFILGLPFFIVGFMFLVHHRLAGKSGPADK